MGRVDFGERELGGTERVLVVHELAFADVDKPPANRRERWGLGMWRFGVVRSPMTWPVLSHRPASPDRLPEELIVGQTLDPTPDHLVRSLELVREQLHGPRDHAVPIPRHVVLSIPDDPHARPRRAPDSRSSATGGRTRPDGIRLDWRTAILSAPLPFIIQDLTSRELRVPQGAAAQHANGAGGIAKVILGAKELADAEWRYARLRERGAP